MRTGRAIACGAATSQAPTETNAASNAAPPNTEETTTAATRADRLRITAALFAGALHAQIDGIPIKVISLDHLIENKRAAGRPQDLIDADFLERVRSKQARE